MAATTQLTKQVEHPGHAHQVLVASLDHSRSDVDIPQCIRRLVEIWSQFVGPDRGGGLLLIRLLAHQELGISPANEADRTSPLLRIYCREHQSCCSRHDDCYDGSLRPWFTNNAPRWDSKLVNTLQNAVSSSSFSIFGRSRRRSRTKLVTSILPFTTRSTASAIVDLKPSHHSNKMPCAIVFSGGALEMGMADSGLMISGIPLPDFEMCKCMTWMDKGRVSSREGHANLCDRISILSLSVGFSTVARAYPYCR